jgi:hypothetical protein
MNENTQCTECKVELASISCSTCPFWKKFCSTCSLKIHGEFNNHKISINDKRLGLIPLKKNMLTTLWIDTFVCNTSMNVPTLFDAIQAGYFGRGITSAKINFSFNILNLYRQLNLNGALTASAFIESIRALQPGTKFPANIKDVLFV